MMFDEINTVVLHYNRLGEQVIVAERVKLLSTVLEERLCEIAWFYKYSEFVSIDTSADAKREEKTMRLKFISRLRSAGSKLKLLETKKVWTEILLAL